MSVFVDTFDPQAKRAVLTIAREDYDSYDQWGWAMNWLFDIAAELATRGDDVPAELNYRPGAFGPEVSEDRAEMLAEFSTEGLTHAARVLNRYATALDKAGESY